MFTHVEERPAVKTRPCNFALLRESFEIRSDSDLCADIRLGKSFVLLAHEVADEFIGKVELDACSDGGVDDQLRRLVLRCTACNAIHDSILSGKGADERLGRGVVNGFVRDVGLRWCCVGR